MERQGGLLIGRHVESQARVDQEEAWENVAMGQGGLPLAAPIPSLVSSCGSRRISHKPKGDNESSARCPVSVNQPNCRMGRPDSGLALLVGPARSMRMGCSPIASAPINPERSILLGDWDLALLVDANLDRTCLPRHDLTLDSLGDSPVGGGRGSPSFPTPDGDTTSGEPTPVEGLHACMMAEPTFLASLSDGPEQSPTRGATMSEEVWTPVADPCDELNQFCTSARRILDPVLAKPADRAPPQDKRRPRKKWAPVSMLPTKAPILAVQYG